MAWSLPFALCSLVAAAGMFVYKVRDDPMASRHEQWMAQYGRTYKDEAEKIFRRSVFKKNVKYIEDFNNARSHSYTLGENQFADLTSKEFMASIAGVGPIKREIEESARSEEPHMRKLSTDPAAAAASSSSKDWRDEGAVTSPKDQGLCGATWIFAAVATVESLFYIKKKDEGTKLQTLSEQQLLDCDRRNEGCVNGTTAFSLQYVKENKGLTTEYNYPYQQQQQKCDVNKAKDIKAYIKGYQAVSPPVECALQDAVNDQPVAVALHLSGDDWQFYHGGIYDRPCSSDDDSFQWLMVLGYGERNSKKYWIAKNSLGNTWGDSGYVNITRGSEPCGGYCGIAQNAFYPILS